MVPPDLRAQPPSRRACRATTLAALCAIAGAASAQGDPGTASHAPAGISLVTQHVIAGGGVTHARSACFDLDGTIAEPVAGSAQGGSFTLDAGFLAMHVATDSLFRNSFEVCQP